MLLKTILNDCNRFKSFVYTKIKFAIVNGEKIIEAVIVPRANSKAICSGCNKEAPLYDRKRLPVGFNSFPCSVFQFILYTTCEEWIVLIVKES